MDQSLIDKYKAAQEKKTSLERKKMELQVKLDSTRKEYKNVLNQLKETYGVNSIDEAEVLRNQMQEELSTSLENLATQLSNFEQKVQGIE